MSMINLLEFNAKDIIFKEFRKHHIEQEVITYTVSNGCPTGLNNQIMLSRCIIPLFQYSLLSCHPLTSIFRTYPNRISVFLMGSMH